MHSGYDIPGIQTHPQQASENNNTTTPVLLSMNHPAHILDQIHTLPATQQRLFQLDQPAHFLPSHHHHYGGVSSPSPYFPAVSFKLGLNDICLRNNNNNNKDGGSTVASVSSINNHEGSGDANLLRGSEQFDVPEARQSSLGLLHCWQNQQDSPIKQPPSFWEHLAPEVSNENSSEIIGRSQQMINRKEHVISLTTCLDDHTKSRPHFSELEAIYKRLGATTTDHDTNQTCPISNEITNLPVMFDHASEPEEQEEEEPSPPLKETDRKKKKKMKRKENYGSCSDQMISPMTEFFGNLVKQVMDHQENLHKKFTEAIERLEEERRAKEEDWRKQELERFEQDCEARKKEKALAKSREAMIVSYLEKITGEKINLPNDVTSDEVMREVEHDGD